MSDVGDPQIPENAPDANSRYAALSSGLTLYLEAVEDFFPYAAARLSLRQYAQHAGEAEKYLPEELEMERDGLRAQLSGMLPRAIRGSALVVLYSAFESTVLDFSKSLASDLECLPFDPFAGAGSFPRRAEKYFSEAFKVQLFSDELEKSGIDVLRSLRNSFIHQQSTFTRLRADIQASIAESKNRLTKCHIHEDVWVPSVECVKAHGELVRNWARLLGHRVIDRVGLDRYL